MNCGTPDANWVCTDWFTVPCDGNYVLIATSNCGTQCTCWNFIACAALMQEGNPFPYCTTHTQNCHSQQCTTNRTCALTAGVRYQLCAARFPCEGGFTCNSCDINPDPCAAIAQLKRSLTDNCSFVACP